MRDDVDQHINTPYLVACLINVIHGWAGTAACWRTPHCHGSVTEGAHRAASAPTQGLGQWQTEHKEEEELFERLFEGLASSKQSIRSICELHMLPGLPFPLSSTPAPHLLQPFDGVDSRLIVVPLAHPSGQTIAIHKHGKGLHGAWKRN